MPKDFYSAVEDRRSYYSIGKDSPVPDTKIEEAVKFAVMHAPSAFNSQSGRVLLLLGREHDALWGIVLETLQKIVPGERFAPTRAKIEGFASGHGTALFFEDQAVVEKLQKDFATFKDNFPLWSLQSSGMLQYVVWTALEASGLGASLQHYNPLIDAAVKARWQIPENWRLLSQMPFGKPTGQPGEKEFLPVEERVKIYR
jgi:predicted oxidoreductase (fatty acid repression mutant protein)